MSVRRTSMPGGTCFHAACVYTKVKKQVAFRKFCNAYDVIMQHGLKSRDNTMIYVDFMMK